MHLLVDGDYLLSGFQPTSEEEVKAAVERLLTAIEQQLLQPVGADTAATALASRTIFFSSALINGLEEGLRSCIISSLRRLRFQTHVLESIRGRAGTPVDAALCTKLLQLSMMPAGGGGIGGDHSAGPPHSKTTHVFCLVTPNAYLSTALEWVASRESGEVVFAVYDGDEVAEELLGYASARYGTSGGVATMTKHDGVTFLPSTDAAVAALALVHHQEQGSLSISALTELKMLQTRLLQKSNGSEAAVVMPKALTTAAAASPPLHTVPDLFAPPNQPQPIAERAPPLSTSRTSSPSSSTSPRDTKCGDQLLFPQVPLDLATLKPSDRVSVPAPPPPPIPSVPISPVPSLVGTGSLHTVTTAMSPAAVAQDASPPSEMPPPSRVSPPATTNGVAGASVSPSEPMVSTVLPEGWALVYDAARQRHYYAYTDTTGLTHSTWQHPLGPQKQLELEEQVQAWRAAQLPLPPAPQPQLSSALPDGWEERLDPKTNRAFYVNHKSRTTTWERPQSSATAHLGIAKVSSHANGGSATSLPAPWEARVDPATGRTFYINHATKTTSWEPPAVGLSVTPPMTSTPLPDVRHPSGNVEANGGDDWVPRVDPATGRTFYINHATKTTSWERPRV